MLDRPDMLLHYLVKHECQQNKPLTINCKVVRIATYLRCDWIVNNQLRKGLLLHLSLKFFNR